MIRHDPLWAAVSAREDVDGSNQCVIYTPNRNAGEAKVEIKIDSAAQARRLARALNKAAKRLSV